MPGRGQPWKEGGHVDSTILGEDIKAGTIEESDLDSALQAKVNAGGGGGGGWTASRLFENETVSGLRLFDHSFVDEEGSAELVNRGTPMPKAGKVKSIFVNIFSGYTTQNSNSEIRVRKNGVNLLVHSYNGTVVALTNTTTDSAFAQGDIIGIALVKTGGTGTADIGVTVEYAFD